VEKLSESKSESNRVESIRVYTAFASLNLDRTSTGYKKAEGFRSMPAFTLSMWLQQLILL
jgi:hypothetical protein